jgi:multiple sugar transport system permease protein
VVPNAKPVFATVAILTFLTQWGALLWPLMVTHSEAVRPLPLGIATFYSLPPLQWGDIFAFGVMMVTPVLLIFVLFQRWFVRGVATTGVKG